MFPGVRGASVVAGISHKCLRTANISRAKRQNARGFQNTGRLSSRNPLRRVPRISRGFVRRGTGDYTAPVGAEVSGDPQERSEAPLCLKVSQLNPRLPNFCEPVSTLDVDREADAPAARPVDYDGDNLPFSKLDGRAS